MTSANTSTEKREQDPGSDERKEDLTPKPKVTTMDTIMKRWRIVFFVVMAYNWHFHYFLMAQYENPWEQAMGYYHSDWMLKLAPMTDKAKFGYKWGGFFLALLSIHFDSCIVIFALISIQVVLTSVTNFVNHDYLFALLSVLLAVYYKCKTQEQKMAWVHALRGQIVVVYAFASLWKFNKDWINGEIAKQIFLSFQEDGVNRGVPWKELYAMWPGIFVFVAASGLLLDTLLFFTLMFLPPGNKMQRACLIFHGFIAFTMSQRIGYSFPAAMISTSFLFRQMHAQDMSHAQWLQGQLSFSTSVKSSKKRRRYILPLLWLLVQWALPLRMPFVSDFNFKYTREGYRWSWTMMLHGSNSAVRAGMTFLTMRPTCNQQPFPNPHANRGPHMDIHSFPYEMLLPVRVSQVVQLFPRQLPKIADKIYDVVQQMCRAGNTTVTISYFSSVNGGAYHRLIDPTADLASIHRVHSTLSYAEKLWLSLKDKPPKGHEFILRGIGTSSLAGDIMNGGWQLVMVDRISCLAVDPIRIHSVALDIEVVETSFPLTLTACEDLELNKCIKTTLTVLNPVSIPPHRTLFIGVDKERMSNNNLSCSNSVKEDVVIRLRNLNSAMPESRPGYEKVRK